MQLSHEWGIHCGFLSSSDLRYRTYTSQTMPIIERYDKKGMVRRISGVPPPDEVRCSTIANNANFSFLFLAQKPGV